MKTLNVEHRDEAIVAAYKSGAYSMKEIAEYLIYIIRA